MEEIKGMSISERLERSFKLSFRNIKKILLLSVIFIVLFTLIALFQISVILANPNTFAGDNYTFFWLVLILFGALFSIITFYWRGSITKLISDNYLGVKNISIKGNLLYIWKLLPRLIVSLGIITLIQFFININQILDSKEVYLETFSSIYTAEIQNIFSVLLSYYISLINSSKFTSNLLLLVLLSLSNLFFLFITIIIVDKNETAFKAIKKSIILTGKNFFKIVGNKLTLFFVKIGLQIGSIIILFTTSALIMFIFTNIIKSSNLGNIFAGIIIFTLIFAFILSLCYITIFVNTFNILLYYDIITEKEDLIVQKIVEDNYNEQKVENKQ